MHWNREGAIVDVPPVIGPYGAVVAHQDCNLVDARDRNHVAHHMPAISLTLNAKLLLWAARGENDAQLQGVIWHQVARCITGFNDEFG